MQILKIFKRNKIDPEAAKAAKEAARLAKIEKTKNLINFSKLLLSYYYKKISFNKHTLFMTLFISITSLFIMMFMFNKVIDHFLTLIFIYQNLIYITLSLILLITIEIVLTKKIESIYNGLFYMIINLIAIIFSIFNVYIISEYLAIVQILISIYLLITIIFNIKSKITIKQINKCVN